MSHGSCRVAPMIPLFLFSLQLLVCSCLSAAGLLPVQHFCSCAALLGLNWCHRFLKILQVMCISDINLSCPKGDREANQLNGKGVKKLPYQNFSRHALLKHKDDIKSQRCCRGLVYFPSCFWYLKCSL